MGARYILALVLMILVMVVWSAVYPLLFPPPLEETPATEQTPAVSGTGSTPPDMGTQTTPRRTEAPLDPDPWRSLPENPDDTKINVHTDNYSIVFNEKLAIAKKWHLNHFPNRSDKIVAPLNLIPENALNCLALRFDSPQLSHELLGSTWTADKPQINITNSDEPETLTFRTTIGEKLNVAKQFTFTPGTYFVDLLITFKNVSDEQLYVNGYELRWGQGINADLLPHEKRSGKRGAQSKEKEGAKAYIGEAKPKREFKESQASATVLWAGLHSRYFSALMIPDPKLAATYKLIEQENPVTDIAVAAPADIAALVMPAFYLNSEQKQKQDAFRIYVGPKDDTILKSIAAPNAPETPVYLSKIIDFGFFWPIAWTMLWIFKGLHGIFRNYGLAIILLTALVKIASYPFTRKAHKSMKEMQKLQPQLLELKEKYRDNPQKLNRATMRLYKEHGVNPLGGCIPWLPQIPIFWALFALLGSAIELRGAPFLLWIADLSAPDTLIELPFTIPLIVTQIDAIRLLPIINGLTTWLQQKFVGNMAPTTDNMQAKLMQFMPLIFIFIFYNWASGFVLYWLCNNVFTIAQQYLQNRQAADSEQIAVADPKRRNRSKLNRNS